jgi:hypothetical protein
MTKNSESFRKIVLFQPPVEIVDFFLVFASASGNVVHRKEFYPVFTATYTKRRIGRIPTQNLHP